MRFLILAFALGMAGCAVSELGPPAAERPVAAELPRFALEGRLQVRDGERTAAVGIDWQHEASRDDWLFTGPLGQGLARIEGDAAGARMTLADGRRSEAARFGAEVMRFSPRQSDLLIVAGRVVDQGWTIEYTEYADESPGSLPRKIDIHRGDTRLRLIVDAWNP